MNSIRTYLIAVILATVTLFNFVAALRGYQSSLVEADQLFDGQLLDSARLIANIDAEQSEQIIDTTGATAFQVWRGRALLMASSNAPGAAISPLEPGFDYNNFDGYRWRTLAYYNAPRKQWVLVAQRTDQRYALAENVILESISPILVGLPLVALLIWVIVSRGLRPLSQLADELGRKRPDDLSALSISRPRIEISQIVSSSNALLARLETSLLREKQFASDAAHELRTPISVLKVQLYNLQEELADALSPEGSFGQGFDELTKTVDRLENMVAQILDFYRNSPDHYHAAFAELDLFALVEDVMAEAHPIFDRKQQQLSFEGQVCRIFGDRFALVTLVQNLLSNANKYSPSGGQVKVSLTATDDEVVLVVEDSGPGIGAELRETVFERFYRIRGDRHGSPEPGSGLGLAIVKGIADLHGASIEIADSGFVTGAAFRVTFLADGLGGNGSSGVS